MNQFWLGIIYFVRAAPHLFKKGLKRFVILPVLFNFIIFTSLFYLFHHYLIQQTTAYIDQLPSWLSFLSDFLLILSAISFFLVFLSMFTVIFNLVAAPFNGLLAEKSQRILYQESIPNLSMMTIAFRSIKRQGQFLLYFLPRFLAMCILFFIPILHPIYPFLWFAFNAWMLSVQYQDFVMDNNLVGFNEMKQKIHQNKMTTLGFGTIINFMSFMPFLNLLTMPIAVIGGVIFYCERMRNGTPVLISQYKN